MICPRCNTENNNGENFCKNCGNRLVRKKNNKPIIITLIICVTVLLITGIIAAVILFGSDSANESSGSNKKSKKAEIEFGDKPEYEREKDLAEAKKADISEVLENTAQFTWEWFYDNQRLDISDTINVYNEKYGYEDICCRINHEKITSQEEMKEYASRFYTEGAVNGLMSLRTWGEKDGHLYTSTNEFNQAATVDYLIIATKTDDENYTLSVCANEKETSGYNFFTATLSFENGNWLLDSIIYLPPDSTITVVKQDDKNYENYMQYMAYLNVVYNKQYNEAMNRLDISCVLFDIDSDGVSEMFIKHGTCEADYMMDVYTYRDGKATLVGTDGGGHCALEYSEKTGRLYKITGHMGAGAVYEYSLKDDNLFVKEIISEYDYEHPEKYDIQFTYLEPIAVTQYFSLDEYSVLDVGEQLKEYFIK